MIRRKITKVTTRMNSGHNKHWAVGGSLYFDLECGHGQGRKLSQGTPKKLMVRCLDCEHLARGGYSRIGNTREGWDAETQMPTRIELLDEPQEQAE